MSNERYLQISYFVVLLCSAGLGLATYGLLRKRFLAVCDASRSRVAVFARRFLLLGTVVPALLGFCSVSYFSCNVTTYQQVIANRDYLLQINLDQFEAVLHYLIIAIMLWCLIVFAVLLTSRASDTGRQPGGLDR